MAHTTLLSCDLGCFPLTKKKSEIVVRTPFRFASTGIVGCFWGLSALTGRTCRTGIYRTSFMN